MVQSSPDLVEMVLRECAAAGDTPWYPSEYVQATGIDRAALDAAADRLRLAGLVQLTEWVRGKGQGYVITPEGQQVLQRPRLLQRLMQGDALQVAPARPVAVPEERAWDRGKAVRDALTTPSRPTMTLVLLALCLTNFVVGLMLVNLRGGSSSTYLGMSGDPIVHGVRHATGALEIPSDLHLGEWWRLLTAAFVHHGLLHLGLNLYALFTIGPWVERFFGRGRYLVLYVLTAVAGSAAAVLLNDPQERPLLAGASTSLCGLTGAMLVWSALNRRHLGEMGLSLLRSTVFNIFLIVLISIPWSDGFRVSWQGHLGGGVAGAVLAVPLNFSRFGTPRQRLAGWLGVLLLLAAFLAYFVYAASPTAVQRARALFMPRFRDTLRQVMAVDKEFTEWANKIYKKEDVSRQETQKLEANIKDAQELLRQSIEHFDRAATKAGGHASASDKSTRKQKHVRFYIGTITWKDFGVPYTANGSWKRR